MGGGYHPNKVFRQCRGRDPCPDAFLWSLGLRDFPKNVSSDNGNGADIPVNKPAAQNIDASETAKLR